MKAQSLTAVDNYTSELAIHCFILSNAKLCHVHIHDHRGGAIKPCWLANQVRALP